MTKAKHLKNSPNSKPDAQNRGFTYLEALDTLGVKMHYPQHQKDEKNRRNDSNQSRDFNKKATDLNITNQLIVYPFRNEFDKATPTANNGDLAQSIRATKHPIEKSSCELDYILIQNNIPIALIKTKDLSNTEIVSAIAKNLGLTFVTKQETESNLCFANSTELRNEFKSSFAPIDILDYIYAMFHSPIHRENHKAFLKTDFQKVQYPKDADTFWQLVKLGGEIRQIHLLESPGKQITSQNLCDE